MCIDLNSADFNVFRGVNYLQAAPAVVENAIMRCWFIFLGMYSPVGPGRSTQIPVLLYSTTSANLNYARLTPQPLIKGQVIADRSQPPAAPTACLTWLGRSQQFLLSIYLIAVQMVHATVELSATLPSNQYFPRTCTLCDFYKAYICVPFISSHIIKLCNDIFC